MSKFLERLKHPRPLLFDGGFGSELFARGVELANSSLASQLYPEVVLAIHADYIQAGADAIETNTFVASELHLEMVGQSPAESAKIARRSAELARQAVEQSGREVFIAGSLGPSPGAIEADSGGTDFGIPNQKVRQAHARLIDALAAGGVDFFAIETMFSAKEAALAADLARRTGLPVAVNLTYKYTHDRATGQVVYRTDWGHSAGDLLDILASGEFSGGDNLLDHVCILGLNCGAETRRSEHTGMPYALSGIAQLRCALEERGITAKRLMAYPNAGLPRLDKRKRTYYAQTPEEMALRVPALLEEGAYLIGGCCGTGPRHIRAFGQALEAHWQNGRP